MSAPAVVVPTKGGEAQPAQAVAATPMKGGMVLSPLPLTGGRRRKTRRISKKVLKMLKKMSKAKLSKLMKGGEEGEAAAMEAPEAAPAAEEGAGRRRKGGRKTHRRSRRSGLLY